MTVEDRDRGLRKIQRNVRAFAGLELAIGIQGPEAGAIEHDADDLTNVELGAIHEFGAPGAGIPERSFIRSTFDAKIKQWIGQLEKVGKTIYSTGTGDPKRALGILGEKAVSDMRNTINRGIDPPLKPATVARKGSSKPLIDSGQLKNAITWKIR